MRRKPFIYFDGSTIAHKECTKCERTLPLSEFKADRGRPNSWCRACYRIYDREHWPSRKKDKEQHRVIARESLRRRRSDPVKRAQDREGARGQLRPGSIKEWIARNPEVVDLSRDRVALWTNHLGKEKRRNVSTRRRLAGTVTSRGLPESGIYGEQVAVLRDGGFMVLVQTRRGPRFEYYTSIETLPPKYRKMVTG